ncbi:MAG: sarcosine oxidase subunit delta [Candidatus Puniceispirillales bacterium]
MIINHPLLGPRDAAEFTVIGDAAAMQRPDTSTPGQPDPGLMDAFHDYMHLRDNPAGVHHELWYHEQGDRSWLVVTRDTVSHEVISVALASALKRRDG